MEINNLKEFVRFSEFSPVQSKRKKSYIFDHDVRLYNSFLLLKEHVVDDMKILSVGGGPCFLEMALKCCRRVDITTFDFEKTIEKNLKSYEQYNIKYIKGDFIKNINDINDKFNLIIMSEFIEHIPLPLSTQINMVSRLIEPNGYIFISTPNIANIYNCAKLLMGKNIIAADEQLFLPVDQRNQHVHRREYTMSEMCACLGKQNFSIIKKDYSAGSSQRTILMACLYPVEVTLKRLRQYLLILGKKN